MSEFFIPAQIDASMIDQVCKVRGTVNTVIENPGGQGGLYLMISGGGGEVAVRVEQETWESLTEAEKAASKEEEVELARKVAEAGILFIID